jgi:uncharacterized membrane protein YjfL (UPF0719 family)
MSGDEVLITVVCAIAGLIAWSRWFFLLAVASRLTASAGPRLVLGLAPLLSGAVLWTVLARWSSADVRTDSAYMFMYAVMGAGWVGLTGGLLSHFGLCVRDDALERDNRAAALAVGGAVLGLTLCFAGGNIGDGPGWWVVVFCAAASSASLLLLWTVLAKWGGLAESISVERDIAAGFRAAGFMVAAGLILGRAVAGDWQSPSVALLDLVKVGWPAAALVVPALAIERKAQPTPQVPHPPVPAWGVLPAAFYLGAALVWLAVVGPWQTS